MKGSRLTIISLTMMALVACTAPARQSAGQASTEPTPAAASEPKHIVAAIMSDPTMINTTIGAGDANLPGMDALEQLLHAGLSIEDDHRVLHPQLAEAVPSTENGLWVLFPDGRMDTTWKIRSGAAWHDGTPFTASDLAFTVTIGQDREIPAFGNAAYNSLDSLEIVDPQTVTIHWKKPFVGADTMFTRPLAYPLPRHILEPPYLQDKSTFIQLPYWSQEFVGAGPYKLAEWVRGIHLLLQANQSYVLGRPQIDEIQVRLIPDPNTLVANILAGAVDVTVGRGPSVEQALQARDQWKEGRVEINLNGWIVMFPQMIDPNPALIRDVRFRKALMYSLDRQQMVDTLMAGQGGVGHSLILPDEPEYRGVEQRVVKYDYDPRQAGQIVEGLGYSRGPDGAYVDQAQQRINLEIRTVATDIAQKATLAVADSWQRSGMTVDQLVIPAARQNDLPYRSTYPGFELFNQPNDIRALPYFYGSAAPIPERNFIGNNHSRYMSPELDALLDRYFVTIPKAERAEVLGDIVHHVTDQLGSVMPLFYNGQPTLVSNRLRNVTAGGANSTQTWNVADWSLEG